MTYEETIREAMEYFGDAVVITGGYDEEIADHYNDLEGDSPEVYVEKDAPLWFGDSEVIGWRLYLMKDDHVASGEPLAKIVSTEDYENLGREIEKRTSPGL